MSLSHLPKACRWAAIWQQVRVLGDDGVHMAIQRQICQLRICFVGGYNELDALPLQHLLPHHIMESGTLPDLPKGLEPLRLCSTLTCMRRFAVAGEMSTAFWKQSFAAEELPFCKWAAARSRCSLLALCIAEQDQFHAVFRQYTIAFSAKQQPATTWLWTPPLMPSLAAARHQTP